MSRICKFCICPIIRGESIYTAGVGYHHKVCPIRAPTLEEWIQEQYPGCDLDRLEIPARLAIQLARMYAIWDKATHPVAQPEGMERSK